MVSFRFHVHPPEVSAPILRKSIADTFRLWLSVFEGRAGSNMNVADRAGKALGREGDFKKNNRLRKTASGSVKGERGGRSQKLRRCCAARQR